MSVSAIAASMRRWLQQQSEDDYPGVHATIRGPADEATISACEECIGQRLPAELRELLKVFDGQNYNERVYEFPCAPWSRFLDCKSIARTWENIPQIMSMCEEEFGADVVYDYQVTANHRPGQNGAPTLAHNDKWTPFAEAYNGEGGAPVLWLLDMDPAPEAGAGSSATGGQASGPVVPRVIGFGGEGDALSIWAPSLTALLQDIFDCMQRRNPLQEENAAAGAGAAGPAPAPEADGPPAAGGLGKGGKGRHRKVLWDDGPRIWYQYQDNYE